MKIKTMRLLLFTSVFFVILTVFAGCISKSDRQTTTIEDQAVQPHTSDTNSTSFDINVSINVSVKLADNVKNINPNIIKAARTAVFNFHCDRAKFAHYNGYAVKEQMNIFEVKETGNNRWEVKYRGTNTPADSYHSVTVEKEKSGSYKGSMVYSSPLIRGDETF